jgi:hypothetical protein
LAQAREKGLSQSDTWKVVLGGTGFKMGGVVHRGEARLVEEARPRTLVRANSFPATDATVRPVAGASVCWGVREVGPICLGSKEEENAREYEFAEAQ